MSKNVYVLEAPDGTTVMLETEQALDDQGVVLSPLRKLTVDEVLKPYPNEHSCRVNDPGKYTQMRRGTTTTERGEDMGVIYGKTDSGWEVQAYRYPTKDWTEAAAKAHCSKHGGGQFHPAAKKSEGEEAGPSPVEFAIAKAAVSYTHLRAHET